MTETATLTSLNAPQSREDFKAFFLQLLEEDANFYYKIKTKLLVKEEKKKKIPNKTPLDMVAIRQKYALKRDAFSPLNDLFKDAPPASELTKQLSK